MIKSKSLPLIILVTGIVLQCGCSDPSKPSTKWTPSEIATYIEANTDLVNVTLEKKDGASGVYSGTGDFEDRTMKCTVTLEPNRISWEAKTDPVSETHPDGRKTVVGSEIYSGSKAW